MAASAALVFNVAGTAATETMGQVAPLSVFDNGNANLLIAQPATLAAQGTLESLSFRVGTPSGNLILGVYSNVANAPSTLLAQTASFVPVAGWNAVPTKTQPILPAGTYWLAYWPSSNLLSFFKQDNVTSKAYFPTVAFGTSMPMSFPTAGAPVTPTLWNLYATLATAVGPPVLGSAALSIAPNPVAVSKPATIAVTVLDQNGNPFAGANVALSASGSGDTITPASGATNAQGVFTATIQSSVAQTQNITATITAGGKSLLSVEPLTAILPAAATSILLAGQAGPNISVTFPSNADAGDLVGAITVGATSGGPYAGTITIGGASGPLFSLSPGANVSAGPYPANLYVGQTPIMAGTYAISLTANP